jgi:hypothetical protein
VEAESTGYVTIGACEDEFPTILAVFTGTEVDHLTEVISGNPNASEGPDCPFSHRQFTFKAKSGTKYEIAVDGNVFHLPEAPPPVTEGEVKLKIEPPPPPPNDAFANATVVSGESGEEPGGNRFYFASKRGYNWLATTEAGETEYGPSSGASVWYSWTAPETATYSFGGLCCGTGLTRNVYVGNALGGLTPLLEGEASSDATLVAGTEVRVAIFGGPDAETGEPHMANFDFFISASLAPHPQPAQGAAPAAPRDTTPPTISIDRSTLRATTRTVKFWFSASEPVQGFSCRLDKGKFKPCGSPRTFKRLAPGRHVFRVKAVDLAGNAGPVQIAKFRVPQPDRGPR